MKIKNPSFIVFVLVVGLLISILYITRENMNQTNNTSTPQSQNSDVAASQVSQSTDGTLFDVEIVNEVPELSTKTLRETEIENANTVVSTSRVRVQYRGWVADTGVVFDESYPSGLDGISFGLNQVIVGWQEGLVGMKVGEIRRVYIPTDKAYNQNPPEGSGIESGDDLIFDVELLEVLD